MVGIWYSTARALFVCFVATLLSIGVSALADGLARLTGVRRTFSYIAVVVVFLSALVVGAWFAIPTLADQFDQLWQGLNAVSAQARSFLRRYAWARELVGAEQPIKSAAQDVVEQIPAALIGIFELGDRAS